jgi:phospholipase C
MKAHARFTAQAAALFVLIGASALLAGCNGGSVAAPAVPATPTPAPSPAATPKNGAAPVAGSPIDHVIVIVQENRTLDNLFAYSLLTAGGPYPGANVARSGVTSSGATVPLQPAFFEDYYDPSHAHASLLTEWNGGGMNGFDQDTVSPALPNVPPARANYAYGFVPPSETLLYHLLAQRYDLADAMFSSRLVPSFPGRLFLISGQSTASDDPTDPTYWGCDAPPGTTVPIFTAASGEAVTTPGPFPCFDYQTLGDTMDAANVSWKYYTGQIGNLVDGQVNTYDAIRHIRNGADWTTKISTPSSNVLADIQNCNLPQVSWVTPPALASDHAGNLSNAGPGWVASIYLAVAQSEILANKPQCQYYGNTTIILTWDDAGGWYDHVAPPSSNGQQWGFRVPLLFISAWSKSGYSASNPAAPPYVSHTVRDFGAILRYIEANWALPSLNQRDASGDALQDLYNYAQTPIPPISTAQTTRLIAKTHYNQIKFMPASTAVDDDK